MDPSPGVNESAISTKLVKHDISFWFFVDATRMVLSKVGIWVFAGLIGWILSAGIPVAAWYFAMSFSGAINRFFGDTPQGKATATFLWFLTQNAIWIIGTDLVLCTFAGLSYMAVLKVRSEPIHPGLVLVGFTNFWRFLWPTLVLGLTFPIVAMAAFPLGWVLWGLIAAWFQILSALFAMTVKFEGTNMRWALMKSLAVFNSTNGRMIGLIVVCGVFSAVVAAVIQSSAHYIFIVYFLWKPVGPAVITLGSVAFLIILPISSIVLGMVYNALAPLASETPIASDYPR